ncbi:MAG: Gfo/Idh/MocA family oxidoreductase, partial [Candidatus Hydrogenedentes bacterium]|nr:Gfo/Idh/MocA family oxidoreductase [Candidatus Hydrogenedentota bacterium]
RDGMKVGIIGCSGMGAHHAQFICNAGFKLAVCGDTIPERAKALAAKFGADATGDCMSVCRRKDVDVVAVLTPTPYHAPYVVAAAEAGKHVFCEKPFGRTMEQCDEALDAVEKADVKLFLGHVVRYFQEFEAIKKQIEAGKVGKVGFVRTYRGGICPVGAGTWFRDWEMSGGVTMDTIIHDFDWIRYVFGDPERIFCQNLKERFGEAIDYSMVTMRMKSGVIATTTGTWAHPAGFQVKVEVCGDNGMIQYDSNEAPISSMMRANASGTPGMIVPGSPVSVSPYQLEWEDFKRWLEGKGEPRVTPEDGVWAVRIALGALESAQTGQPVTFN